MPPYCRDIRCVHVTDLRLSRCCSSSWLEIRVQWILARTSVPCFSSVLPGSKPCVCVCVSNHYHFSFCNSHLSTLWTLIQILHTSAENERVMSDSLHRCPLFFAIRQPDWAPFPSSVSWQVLNRDTDALNPPLSEVSWIEIQYAAVYLFRFGLVLCVLSTAPKGISLKSFPN